MIVDDEADDELDELEEMEDEYEESQEIEDEAVLDDSEVLEDIDDDLDDEMEDLTILTEEELGEEENS